METNRNYIIYELTVPFRQWTYHTLTQLTEGWSGEGDVFGTGLHTMEGARTGLGWAGCPGTLSHAGPRARAHAPPAVTWACHWVLAIPPAPSVTSHRTGGSMTMTSGCRGEVVPRDRGTWGFTGVEVTTGWVVLTLIREVNKVYQFYESGCFFILIGKNTSNIYGSINFV